MKRLVCELCKSTDFVKTDGVFVCQVCSCKYSVEEAKKLMFDDGVEEDNVEEDNVEEDNVVSSDTVSSVKVSGLYEVARRARRNGNSSQAAKYYDMILIQEPNSWEAQFYSIYFSSMDCTIAEIAVAAKDIENCLESIIDLIVANAKDENEKEEFLTQVTEDLNIIADLFLEAALDHQVNIDDSIRNKLVVEFNSRVYSIESMLSEFVQLLLFRFGDDLFALQLVDKTLRKSKKACQTAYQQFCRTYFYPEKKELRSKELSVVSEAIKLNEQKIKEVKENNDRIEKCADKEKCYTDHKVILNMSCDITELDECIKVFEILDDFKDSKQQKELCQQKITNIKNKEEFNKANELKNSGMLAEAKNILKSILATDCSDEMRQKSEKLYEDIENAEFEKERKEKEAAELKLKKKKRRKNATLGVLAAIVSIFVCVLTVINCIIPNIKYNDALTLKNEGKYSPAIEIFKEIEDYKDSTEQKKECYYNIGKLLLDKKEIRKSVAYFAAADDFADSKDVLAGILNEISVKETISATLHTVALKSDGTVVAAGNNLFGKCEVSEWKDIVSVFTASDYTLGLKSDGTVVATSSTIFDEDDESVWTNIVSLSCGGDHIIGLKSDGTVVAEDFARDYHNTKGRSSVSHWSGIIAVSAGYQHTVGLRSNGTVIATDFRASYGDHYYGQCDVDGWTDITAISAGGYHTVGLKSDGTVVAVGDNTAGQCNVEEWTDIVAVSANRNYTIGLKSDGTVVATEFLGDEDNYYGQCDVDNWTDIVAVSAGSSYAVGLKSDGTVVATKFLGDEDNYYGQCDVYDWYDIKLP